MEQAEINHYNLPRKSVLLFGPHFDRTNQIEFSVHQPSRRLIREIQAVFPALCPPDLAKLRVVSTFQPAQIELTSYEEATEKEKDRLLNKFLSWSSKLRHLLLQVEGETWADCVDPSSGLPYWSQRGSSIYCEVDAAQVLLGYELVQAGACAVCFCLLPGVSLLLFSTPIISILAHVSGSNN